MEGKSKLLSKTTLNGCSYREYCLNFLKMTQRDNEWIQFYENICCFEKKFQIKVRRAGDFSPHVTKDPDQHVPV